MNPISKNRIVFIVLLLSATFVSKATLAQQTGGQVSGITTIQKIKCKNKTTGQRVTIKAPVGTSWNCEQAGLVVNTGDVIVQSVYGEAQGDRPDSPEVTATAGDGSATLRWQPDFSAFFYNVYMSQNPDFRPGNNSLLISYLPIWEITIPDLANDQTYYFYVTGVNSFGESALSNRIAVTPQGPQPFDHQSAIGIPCAQCHDNIAATGKPATHPLTTNFCEGCHITNAWLPVVVPLDHSQTADQCETCHNGQAATGMGPLHIPTNEDCGSCHNVSSWIPTVPGPDPTPGPTPDPTPDPNPTPFDHNTVVGQPCVLCHDGTIATGLSPNHIPTNEDCGLCHSVNAWFPAANPFPVFDHSPFAGQACAQAGCHDGISGPTFKSASHPITSNTCAACHTTNGWLPVTVPLDHSQTTDTCVACHNGQTATGKSATHPLTPDSCEQCHTTSTWLGAVL